MTAKKRLTTPFDVAEYLDDDAVVAAYLSEAASDPDPDVLFAALGDVAKARGMAEISRRSGLGRESLYKSLSSGAKPRHETLHAVLRAIGLTFAVIPLVAERNVAAEPVRAAKGRAKRYA